MTRINAVVFHGPNSVGISKRELLALGSGQVVIRPTVVGITSDDIRSCVGSAHGRTATQRWPKVGTTLGSEVVGVVASVAEDVGTVEPGDRVVVDPAWRCRRCRDCLTASGTPCAEMGLMGFDRDGALADLVVVPGHACFVVPSNVSDEHAVMTNSLARGLRAVRRSGLAPGDDVAIFGADDFGLAVVLHAIAAGARSIAVVDPRPLRRLSAERLGASILIDPALEDPIEALRVADPLGPNMVYISFESYVPEASHYLLQACQVMRVAGTAVVVQTQDDQGFAELVHGRLATPLSKETCIRFVGPASGAEPSRGDVERGDWARTLENLSAEILDLRGVESQTVGWSRLMTQDSLSDLLNPSASASKMLVGMDL